MLLSTKFTYMIVRLGFLVTASVAAAYIVKQLIVKTPKPIDTPSKPYEYGLVLDEKLRNQGGENTHEDGLDDLVDLVFVGFAEWADLPTDILVLIAKRIEIFEDFCNFCEVCKSWNSVTSILGKYQTLPSYFPWIMLTDKAEKNYPKVPKVTRDMDTPNMLIGEVRKNEQIEGMHNRQFFSFSASKSFEFELPEATRKKCLGVGYGLLLTLDFDLEINILNPFTRQQISMPNMLSFKSQFIGGENVIPQHYIQYFFVKVAMSANPYKQSNQDCIIMAIYGKLQVLGFARLGDKVWTDVRLTNPSYYVDVVYYNGKFYAVNLLGVIDVCDINDANDPKVTPIACLPEYIYHKGHKKSRRRKYSKYLVELSGDLLVVIRVRKGLYYDDKQDKDKPYNYTVGFTIFKLEKCHGVSSDNYSYKLREVFNLGNNALFIGNSPSVSVPASRFVKANSIYFSEDEVPANMRQPYGGGYDTGIYDMETGNVSLHYASKFMSLLTPPTWIIT